MVVMLVVVLKKCFSVEDNPLMTCFLTPSNRQREVRENHLIENKFEICAENMEITVLEPITMPIRGRHTYQKFE